MHENKQRIPYLDALRLIATFAVIAIHMSSPGNRNSVDYLTRGGSEVITFSFFNKLSHWAVPIFVMISGALFLNPNKAVTINDVFRKLFPRLAIPYFFWWAFYACLLSAWAVFAHKNWSIGYLAPYSHLWFLPMLMSIYLIIPLLKKVVESNSNMRYFLILWLVFTILESVHYLDKIFDVMYMEFVMGYSGYFVLGYFLSTIDIKPSKRKFVYVLATVMAASIVVLDVVKKIYSWNLFNSYMPFYVVMSTALFVWFKYHDWTRFSKLFGKVRPYLFGVYLIHIVFVLIFTEERFYYSLHPLIYLPVSIITIFFLSLGGTWVITKIPFLRKVVE